MEASTARSVLFCCLTASNRAERRKSFKTKKEGRSADDEDVVVAIEDGDSGASWLEVAVGGAGGIGLSVEGDGALGLHVVDGLGDLCGPASELEGGYLLFHSLLVGLLNHRGDEGDGEDEGGDGEDEGLGEQRVVAHEEGGEGDAGADAGTETDVVAGEDVDGESYDGEGQPEDGELGNKDGEHYKS